MHTIAGGIKVKVCEIYSLGYRFILSFEKKKRTVE